MNKLEDTEDKSLKVLEHLKTLESCIKRIHWVSVKERLPSDGINVLVFDPEKGHSVSHIVRGTGRPDDYIWSHNPFGNATHWMPLPEPPK